MRQRIHPPYLYQLGRSVPAARGRRRYLRPWSAHRGRHDVLPEQRFRSHRGVVAAGGGSEVSPPRRLRTSRGHHWRRAVRVDECLYRTGGRAFARVGWLGATDRDSSRVVSLYGCARTQAAARHQCGRSATLIDRFGAPVLLFLTLLTGVRGRTILGRSHQVRATGIMHRREKRRARRTPYMSIFPTKVLLAIDGSKEAELAARSAAALADKTSSEL